MKKGIDDCYELIVKGIHSFLTILKARETTLKALKIRIMVILICPEKNRQRRRSIQLFSTSSLRSEHIATQRKMPQSKTATNKKDILEGPHFLNLARFEGIITNPEN